MAHQDNAALQGSQAPDIVTHVDHDPHWKDHVTLPVGPTVEEAPRPHHGDPAVEDLGHSGETGQAAIRLGEQTENRHTFGNRHSADHQDFEHALRALLHDVPKPDSGPLRHRLELLCIHHLERVAEHVVSRRERRRLAHAAVARAWSCLHVDHMTAEEAAHLLRTAIEEQLERQCLGHHGASRRSHTASVPGPWHELASRKSSSGRSGRSRNILRAWYSDVPERGATSAFRKPVR